MLTLQTSFKPLLRGGGRGKFVRRGDCEQQLFRLFSQLRPRFRPLDPLVLTHYTVILFSSLYFFPAKSICPTCKLAIHIFVQIRAAAPPSTQQKASSYLCLNLCCCRAIHGHDSSASSGRVWQLFCCSAQQEDSAYLCLNLCCLCRNTV